MRFKFVLDRARLYAFWVSPSARGESRGYLGAGGPGFAGSDRRMISRRAFLAGAAASLAVPLPVLARQSETLYNGITLGRPWPPDWRSPDEHPTRPPYLADRPAVVPIDVGRQLFVDDFLIEDTTMSRTFHKAAYHAANPILQPERDWETYDDVAARTEASRSIRAAMVFSDGVFFDPKDRIFKLWYIAGYGASTCLAILARRHDVGETHARCAARARTSSTSTRATRARYGSISSRPDPAERFKMAYWHDHVLVAGVSPDGIHWTELGATGTAGDRSTFFYNPFRRVWAFGVKADQFAAQPQSGRYRRYWESADFRSARQLVAADRRCAWVKADSRDPNRPDGGRPELYNLDCVGYESLMLGLFTIWRGETTAAREDQRDRGRIQPRRLPLGSARSIDVPRRLAERGRLELGQRAIGRRLLPGGRRSALFLCQRPPGPPGHRRSRRLHDGLAMLRRDGFASMDWMPGDGGIVRGRVTRHDSRHADDASGAIQRGGICS